jgi:hypothetical protein
MAQCYRKSFQLGLGEAGVPDSSERRGLIVVQKLSDHQRFWLQD